MAGPWTGGLTWICRSRRRWAAGGPAPTPSSCSPLATRPASSQRCSRSRPRQKLDASESQIICRVGFGPTGHGGFGLTVALDLHAPFLTREQGADLMARAHERCPYSNATRGNIDVVLSVDGVPLAAAAKVPS